MIKLFGNPVSTCTRKVLMTLAETNTPFEHATIDIMKGEHKGDEHVRRQPFGRIPAIEDGDFKLFESRAICRYIARKVGSDILPTDLRTFAKTEQWISIETSEFSGHAMKFIYQYVMKREQDAAALEAAGKALEVTCAAMEKQLASTPFLAGSAFTLADVCFMPYIEYAMASPVKEMIAKNPHVSSWWNKISERPTWQRATGKAG
jgi:glutathione S-transferase